MSSYLTKCVTVRCGFSFGAAVRRVLRQRYMVVVSLLFCQAIRAADLQVLVTDLQGQPLEDAAVEILTSEQIPAKASATVAQQDLTFVPFVSAVTRGTAIEFPNRDKTRHHVYSFSKPKVFELKLYAGKPEKPILFDKAGVVALGCNIHDHMQAFIYVSESAFVAVSDQDGIATFHGLPAELVKLNVWHPWQTTQTAVVNIQLPVQQQQTIAVAITRQQKPQKPKKGFGKSYN